ncbi:uncharacterized protein MONBRDRAFT_23867 [Monosiga brevicollis MX1]|uniref:Uncharacterized protein n=1 Tax=Monosiga brevicollis TaxID=81824 RepID=A9UV29_MONBE|nr:uncharacterized protein MONBRDRAFT_23867 [Monosiga brevicollis MX1]EDQ90822.1 predicted protein [Monosiga brevicollis MX1]|eukprot:XP_001744119.1 hypothetical protein [Monosiga brevicollis MX1]
MLPMTGCALPEPSVVRPRSLGEPSRPHVPSVFGYRSLGRRHLDSASSICSSTSSLNSSGSEDDLTFAAWDTSLREKDDVFQLPNLRLNTMAPDFHPTAVAQGSTTLIRPNPVVASAPIAVGLLEHLPADAELTSSEIKHALPSWMCVEVCDIKFKKTRRGCRGHRKNRRRHQPGEDNDETLDL